MPALRGLVRAAFDQRRKTLEQRVGLFDQTRAHEIEDFLRLKNIDPQRRGETLSVDEFIRLARAVHDASSFPDNGN